LTGSRIERFFDEEVRKYPASPCRKRGVAPLAGGAPRCLNRGMDGNKCPFCKLDASRIRAENDVAAAFPDAFPLMDGHTLIVPRRHLASLFDLPLMTLSVK
jgi:hypothetical protein